MIKDERGHDARTGTEAFADHAAKQVIEDFYLHKMLFYYNSSCLLFIALSLLLHFMALIIGNAFVIYVSSIFPNDSVYGIDYWGCFYSLC